MKFSFLSLICAALVGISASAATHQRVAYDGQAPAGYIVIHASERRLYFINGDGTAERYSVAVGKSGHGWSGSTSVAGKFVRPDWSPPEVVSRDHPELPAFIPGGAPNNPMGERAITLALDQVAIHGTTVKMRKSIGTAASYGCIRMLNEDVVDLFDRVQVGTPVVMVP